MVSSVASLYALACLTSFSQPEEEVSIICGGVLHDEVNRLSDSMRKPLVPI